MAVSPDDVRRVAALARLGLEPDRVDMLVKELNGILSHMDVLAAVDTSTVGIYGDGAGVATPLRPDVIEPLPLAQRRDAIAPEMRDGFFLVPRLLTHEDAAGES